MILPVYNAEAYLRESVDSILSQTYGDFELLAINDGSTDGSGDILRSYTDPRLRVLDNPGNRGIVYSLNRGLSEARGKYIARMDADDISRPERLAKQAALMEASPGLDVCGAWISPFSDDGTRKRTVKYRETDAEIRGRMVFGCELAHPCVMLRRKTMEEGGFRYDEAFRHCEDYELWSRMMRAGCRFHNLQEILLDYRVGQASISHVHGGEMRRLREEVTRKNLEWIYGEEIPGVSWEGERQISFQEFQKSVEIMDELLRRAKTDGRFLGNTVLFDGLRNFRLRYIRKHRCLGLRVWRYLSPADAAFKVRYQWDRWKAERREGGEKS